MPEDLETVPSVEQGNSNELSNDNGAIGSSVEPDGDATQASNETPVSEGASTSALQDAKESTTVVAKKHGATASSYRDIIAERLARSAAQGAPSTPRPMAHASDVAPHIEAAPVASAGSGDSPEPPDIKVSSPESVDGTTDDSQGRLSSRERARLRQKERAELRRTGRKSEVNAEQQPAGFGKDSTLELGLMAMANAPVAFGDSVDADTATASTDQTEPAEREIRPRKERRERPERTAPERRQHTADVDATREKSRPAARPSEAAITDSSVKQQPEEERTERQHKPREQRERQSTSRRTPSDFSLKTGEPSQKQKSRQADRPNDPASLLASSVGVSVVVPLFNEQDSLRELTSLLRQQLVRLAGPKYEILYIDDGSTDRSPEILKDILAVSSHVSCLTFRRNMGKSAALAVGFAEAKYGIVVTMDADLQDDPGEIPNLVAKLAEGADLVSGWKKKRHDPIMKTGPSKFFNTVTSLFSGIKLHDFNCGLKAYRKAVTDSLQVYGEMHRYLPALAHWQGFRVVEIPVVHHPRKFGKSKFGTSRFLKGFLDLLSIVFINRYGKRPLHLFGSIGGLLAVIGFLVDLCLTGQKIFYGTSLSNRPMLLFGALLLLVGVQLVSLGLLGEMLVKNSNTTASLRYVKEEGKRSGELRDRRISRAARLRGRLDDSERRRTSRGESRRDPNRRPPEHRS